MTDPSQRLHQQSTISARRAGANNRTATNGTVGSGKCSLLITFEPQLTTDDNCINKPLQAQGGQAQTTTL
jgi:hypothetical protein